MNLATHFVFLLPAFERPPLVDGHAVVHIRQLEDNLTHEIVAAKLVLIPKRNAYFLVLDRNRAERQLVGHAKANIEVHATYNILLPSFQLGSSSFLMTRDLYTF